MEPILNALCSERLSLNERSRPSVRRYGVVRLGEYRRARCLGKRDNFYLATYLICEI